MNKGSKWVSSNFAENFGRRTGSGNPDIMSKAHEEKARRQMVSQWDADKEAMAKIWVYCPFGMLSGHYAIFSTDWERHIEDMFSSHQSQEA